MPPMSLPPTSEIGDSAVNLSQLLVVQHECPIVLFGQRCAIPDGSSCQLLWETCRQSGGQTSLAETPLHTSLPVLVIWCVADVGLARWRSSSWRDPRHRVCYSSRSRHVDSSLSVCQEIATVGNVTYVRLPYDSSASLYSRSYLSTYAHAEIETESQPLHARILS